jgi:PAS domain S-box-containing protein
LTDGRPSPRIEVVYNAKIPIEIAGSWTDVTERKEAEAAREEARSRLTLLLGAAPSVIYSFCASGDFAPTFVSTNIAHMLGYSPDQYLKDADFWRTRVHPDDLPEVEAKQVELFRNGEHLAEYRFRRKNGTYCWVSDEQHLIRDASGRPVEVVGSWSDIDARKAAELALQASQIELEKATRAALETADYGYVLETGCIVHSGPAPSLIHDPRVIASYLGGKVE